VRFLEIMRDRRGFVHKRLIGAVGGFISGGGIPGAVAGFISGGGGSPAVPGRMGPVSTGSALIRRLTGGIITRRAPPPTFAPAPLPITRVSPLGTGGTMTASALGVPDLGFCFPGFTKDPISGRCVLDVDPGAGTGLPFGPEPAGGTGLVSPTTVCVETMVCPQFADGKKGVLWMSALTGLVVCLPRGVNGSGFGLIRKNRPRRKAFVTAAEISRLQGQATTRKKAKKFAALTGQVCAIRGRAPRRTKASTNSRSSHE